MKTYLEPNEVELMEKAAACFRDRLLIRLLFRLGCRISEALALKVEEIDFGQSTVTIEHLKARINLCCPRCGARLGKSHKFCPICGDSVEKAVAQEKEHRRVRTLPVDGNILKMLADFVRRDKTKGLIFRINRHRAWQVVKECAERAGLPDLVNPETGKVHGVSPGAPIHHPQKPLILALRASVVVKIGLRLRCQLRALLLAPSLNKLSFCDSQIKFV